MFIENKDNLFVFDCDGVLVDSEFIIASVEAEALTKEGYPITAQEDIRLFSGKSQKTMIEFVEADLGQKLPMDFGHDLDELILIALTEKLKPITHVASLLSSLPIKCVASSSTPQMIEYSLRRTELNAFFPKGTVFSASMVKNGKPAPDLFLYAVDHMGFTPCDCIVIEDSIAGVAASKAAGMTAIGFVGGSHIFDKQHSTDLINAGASRVFSDMRELEQFIRKSYTQNA